MTHKDHWDAVYRTRSPAEVSWYQDNPVRSRELIRRTITQYSKLDILS